MQMRAAAESETTGETTALKYISLMMTAKGKNIYYKYSGKNEFAAAPLLVCR
jgi:hypothetical protein